MSAGGRWARRLFWVAVTALAFGGGAYVAWSGVFPWKFIYNGVKTGVQTADAWRRHDRLRRENRCVAGVPTDSVDATRIRPTTSNGGSELSDPVVFLDHPRTFVDPCVSPHGYVAVEYRGPGNAGMKWPFRPDLLARAAEEAQPLEKTPGIPSADVFRAAWATPYPNGDLLVSFHYQYWHHPSYAGAGRVGQDGQVLWFTPEGYSHHEAHVGAGDTVWVAGATLEEPVRRLPGLGTWECDRLSNLVLDRINVLDESGALVDSVSVLDAFLASRWAPALIHADPCDPFHLNSVSMVGEDVSGLPDVRPGDLVLSFRNLDAFAVLDRETGVVKRYARGTFVRQHSVKHLGGSEFVLFDNQGGYEQDENDGYPYSRVLVVDLASGEERVLFPRIPAQQWFSRIRGRVSLSPDRTRVLASFTRSANAVEVRIADGAVLAELDFVRRLGSVFYTREAR